MLKLVTLIVYFVTVSLSDFYFPIVDVTVQAVV